MTEFPGLAESKNLFAAVSAELEKVLASKGFASSPRLSRFLRYVVQQTLDGNAPSLKEYKLGLEVFDRGEDFDPRADAVVRVEARQVRFKLSEYYSEAGTHDGIVITLPKGGYFAVFERRTAEVEENVLPNLPQPEAQLAQQEAQLARRPGVFKAAVSFVVLAALGAGLWLWKSGFTGAPSEPSVAVLPFANLSADPTNQYFSDGLTDEITGELSRVKNLRVIARASAFQFRGKTTDLREVGRQLGVSTVLEGSVERYGDHVKIIAHLERVSDGSHLWAKSYERQTTDLFTIQSELAAAIAANLNGASVPPPRHVVRNEEAHDAYMQARYEMDQGTVASVLRAQANFQKAVDSDPEYPAAYAGLGSAIYNLGASRANSKFTDRNSSERMWNKALALDPTLEEAHCGLALLAMQYEWDWPKAEREVQAALAFGPSARAELRYAQILVYQKRFREADEHLRRSQEIDPVGPRYMMDRGQVLMSERRPAQARKEIEKLLVRYPDMVQAQIAMGVLDFYGGHPDLALARMHKLAQSAPAARMEEAAMLAAQGHREEALKLIRADEDNFRNGNIPMSSFALVYGEIGDRPNTLKWLERSVERHESQALSLGLSRTYEKMQNDPGIVALKRRMHLPQ